MNEAGDDPSEEKTVSYRQIVQSSAEIILLLWAWLKCWSDMISNGYMVYEQFPQPGGPDIKFLAPLAVLVVGLFMTNLLGCVHFVRQGLWAEACIAAVDIDTPYLAYQHGKQVVQGQNCPEWEALRLRNSPWRSLPLAMVTFMLAFRVIFEIPACRAIATLSALAVGTFPHLSSESLWVQDMERDGLNATELSFVRNIKDMAEKVPSSFSESSRDSASKALKIEGEAWTACHCSDSQWQIAQLGESQDAVQNWVGRSVVLDLDRSELGGIGSGNLLAMNFVFFQRMKADAMEKESFLRPQVVRLVAAQHFRFAVGFLRGLMRDWPWEDLVENLMTSVAGSLQKTGSIISAVTLDRPWTLSVSDNFTLQIDNGWKLHLFQTFTLLLVAMLPVRKRILSSFQRPSQLLKGLVTLHMSLDIACVATSWILCALKPSAYHLGNLAKTMIEESWRMAKQLIESSSAISPKDWPKAMPGWYAEALIKICARAYQILSADFVPSLAWDWRFFLQLAAGSLLFIAISAALAYILCQDLTTSLPVGVCGPLWLVTGEIKSVKGLKTTTRAAFILMLSRTMLLATIVALTWSSVDAFSLQFFFAGICNRVFNVIALKGLWLGVLALHCMSGLAAIFFAQRSLEMQEEMEESRFPDHSEGIGGKSAYGTFP